MTIDELIARLEDYRDEIGGDAEVRLMTQQNWPFENTICGLASGAEINDFDEDDEALVFAEHAESEEYELGRTKISKLWIQEIKTKKTLFNFDRGLDVPAATTEIQVVVDFLGCGLADLVWGS
jgi:hypothetical protein